MAPLVSLQKKADTLGRKLDSIPKTKMIDVTKPYRMLCLDARF